ncbi:hypothetical protein HY086_03705 [Candidatus Gottesmanbacteria bacterium]|nr:hypothetical protein [Candidatus Gottesmanbacteria bacterium]
MQIVKKYREYILVSFIIVLAVLTSISQTLLYLFQTPSGHTFLFAHNFLEDYYYYLHLMRQGWEGYWLATSWMTPEKFLPAFVNTWFLFLGHLAKFLNVSLPLMYFFSRIAGGVTLLLLSYVLIQKIFSNSLIKRIVALLFVSFSTYWWGWSNGGPTVAPLVHQWTELDPLFRTSFVPHHLWAKVFMVAAFFLILRRKTFFLLALVFFMGLTNPVVYVTYLPIILLWRTRWHFIAISFFVAGAIGLYDHYLELHIFPWSSYLPWEQTVRYPVSLVAYLQSLGPTFPLFLVALGWLWKKGSVGRLLIAWVAVGFLNIFVVSKFVTLSNSRYLGGYQFIPLAIGAVEGIWRFARPVFRATLAFLLLGYFSVGLWASWKEHVGYVEQNKNNIQIYVPNDLLDAFRFIENNTPKDAVIAAPYEISTMIPALTGRRVVAGHQLMTYQAQTKRIELEKILSGQMKKYNTTYVLIPITSSSAQNVVFQNASYTVFAYR